MARHVRLRELLVGIEGQHDEIPERAFFMKGSIDQVVEEARQG